METERKEGLDNMIYAANHPEKVVQQEQYDLTTELEIEVTKLRNEVAKLRAEVEYQKNLNKNLLRINKERANAQRNLRPKKAHTGYTVLSSRERIERYKAGKTLNAITVWETILQSPYSIDFPENQARKQIFEELLTQEGGWLLGKVGINSRWITGLEEIMKSPDANAKNRAYSVKLNANYKSGYWEYVVRHTLPLSSVPKEMLP